MGSRLREKTKHLFEVFLEIAKPTGKDEAPFIVQQYPPDFDDKEALMMIPRFAYPCQTEVAQVEYFTFVLTDLDSMFRFGYCRHTAGHPTCLCIVSWLPWFEIFYKMLDLLIEITNRSENNLVTTFLQATYAQEVPLPKIPVTIVAGQDMFSFTAPDPNMLPRIPGSRNLTEYYNAVDTNNMMLIFASMLHERRIYMTSKKLSRLTACIHAAEALLYPMHWQHLYIPVLPAHLIDYISAPMPYLIGVHSSLLEKLTQNRVDIGDAVFVDLDYNTVSSEYDDLGDLPEDVSNYLKRNLKPDVIRNSMLKAGDAIPMAFLNALVRLIGGYRDALKFRLGEPITFDPEAFVRSRPSPATQAFLEGMLTLQIFQQFIYGRLEILNAGDGFTDIFEQQATLFTDKLNSQSRYKEWLKSVKKSGKKGWNGLKVKMKVQGKKAMADLKTKLSGLTENEDKKYATMNVSGGVIHTKVKARPVTAHAGTLPRMQRIPSNSSYEFDRRIKPPARARSIEETHDDSQLRLSYHTVDMSLMTDTDIQTAMLRSASAEILSGQAEDYSTDSGSEFGDSENDATDSSIPFEAIHSSDEGLNSTPSGKDSTANNRRELAGDKLILTRQAVTNDPVAAPRNRRTKPDSFPVGHVKANVIEGQKQSSEPSESNMGVQDAPLIKFDSPESDSVSSDMFDPLKSGSSVNFGFSSEDDWCREAQTKSDEAANNSTKMFDPLSDLSGLSFSSSGQPVKVQDAESFGHSVRSDPLSKRRESSDLLMQEWSLASLSRNHMSLSRPAQPLKMSFPNNPFIQNRFQNPSEFSAGQLKGGSLHNYGQISAGYSQFHASFLGHKVSDFHKMNQLGPRKALKPSGSPLPAPRHLSPASYAPYSKQQSSFTPQVVNKTATKTTTALSNHLPSASLETSSDASGMFSTSETASKKQSEFMSDLLDIDFGGSTRSTTSPELYPHLHNNSFQSSVPAQSNWETFD